MRLKNFTTFTKCPEYFQSDATTARIESLSERLKFVNWASMEYDFNIEKSVIQDVGITDTLRRLHAS